MVHTLAKSVLALDEEIAGVDAQIAARFREHRDAEVILSMPGTGLTLDAEFIACTGSDMDAFGSAGRLAGVAGLAPVPRDSGRITGNMRRPHRYHCRLLRVYSPPASVRHPEPSTTTRGPRARATSRQSLPSPAVASTCCGHSSATKRHYSVQPPEPEAVPA
ncbi:hypothetical protein B1H19_32880 [Streptomyces gilvosporeus]|uniref:Transposase IS116/IS110/IS902 C-terminal domain-containing protein n=1 Tax=Streptomyces gilvosporeus TaxID=553510 RepID=A0A1V0U091_9ACTN|nr:hypothetical protein B1H19_32880 [Streptomyces gilvosporeus]